MRTTLLNRVTICSWQTSEIFGSHASPADPTHNRPTPPDPRPRRREATGDLKICHPYTERSKTLQTHIHNQQGREDNKNLIRSDPTEAVKGSPGSRCLTCFGAHVVQQLHHPFALHGGPVFDGRPSSDLAVLLLDLGGATLGDERPQFAVKSESTRFH